MLMTTLLLSVVSFSTDFGGVYSQEQEYDPSITPSQDYYNRGIATRAGDDDLDPGGSGGGDGPAVGGSPIGDGVVPVAVAIALYGFFVTVKRFRRKVC